MNINIPESKRKVSDKKCSKRALAFHVKKKETKHIGKNMWDVVVKEDLVYYPYWIETVHTQKERALAVYPDKKKDFYITCDATDGKFIVLQNIPKLMELKVESLNVLQETVTEEQMRNDIFKEAVSDRINRQFIFGPPQVKLGALRMIYLPMVEVQIKRKGYESHTNYFVNIYTGEVKED